MVDLIKSLEFYFEGQCTYVSGNLLLYYEKDDLNKRCAPDVLVALGVPPHKRDNYLLWKEGKAPDFVIEVTSKSTRSRDTGKKKKLYARLGVREYCIFDPLRDYLPCSAPQIRLYRLSKRGYLPVTGKPLHLETIGLDLEIAENILRLRVPGAENYLPTTREEKARADEATARAAEEKARADAEKARADDEKARAAEEKARADAEKARADAATAKAQKLARRLEQMGIDWRDDQEGGN